MVEKIFTIEDQNMFAKLSGDYNPLHVDEIAARRYLFGGTVVHGIHMALWAMDEWLKVHPQPIILKSFKAVFKKNLPVKEKICIRFIHDEKDRFELELSGQGQIYAMIHGQYSVGSNSSLTGGNLVFPPQETCTLLCPENIVKEKGQVELFFGKETAARLLPYVQQYCDPEQIAQILASTRMVGMKCPGLHSIFSELDLSFEVLNSSDRLFHYQVEAFDDRFSSVEIKVKGPSAEGIVKAFIRPLPIKQTSFSELRSLVDPFEFKEQRALVIGASRGLGEVSAKLLAAGGARVMLTYFRGREDCAGVVADIKAGQGQAEMSYFNVLSPDETAGNEINQFQPTDIYYFATPHITANRNQFSAKLFNKFTEYYVTGFFNTVELIFKKTISVKKIFYPSSIFVGDAPLSLGEYSAAKSAAETLCSWMRKIKKNIFIFAPRLPKMATDQTVTIIPEDRVDPGPVILKYLREFESLCLNK
ncbi:MAG: SDR family NAD(P)-dependent oxidoreductase [Candidatus Omnitrophica bacterium]|nr:SDR family NAD(P)-dependent oxidoreductase [Candidatus Omnitrophota bacterium]